MKRLVKLSLFLLAVASLSSCATSKAIKVADQDTNNWRYELSGEDTGEQGTYLVKVWSYSKKPAVAKEQAKKNAVHGIIFKGFSGSKQGVSSQKPLVKDSSIQSKNEQFFKDFFAAGGDYMKYVNLSDDGAIASGDILKVNKREYKVAVVVSVRKDALRKYLENAGIIRGLSSGF